MHPANSKYNTREFEDVTLFPRVVVSGFDSKTWLIVHCTGSHRLHKTCNGEEGDAKARKDFTLLAPKNGKPLLGGTWVPAEGYLLGEDWPFRNGRPPGIAIPEGDSGKEFEIRVHTS
jgi:hypothetical protein